MRYWNYFIVLLLSFWMAKSLEVPCERVKSEDTIYWCHMDGTTEIKYDNVEISNARNESITRILFEQNREIFYLPIEMHEKFPNMRRIYADHCSISAISKKNFNKLSELQYLDLDYNKIKNIASDTFDDLVQLEQVYLEGNQIKFVNGKLFEKKPLLWVIEMRKNVCIDKNANKGIQNFMLEITAQCGFDEEPVGESNLLVLNCGRVSYPKSRVIGGNEFVRGKWPFIVSLILESNGKYFCGGNLISSKHVLTAAHCLHNKYQIRQLAAEDIAVLLGRHDLKALYERGSTQRELAEIVIHPNWKNDTQKYDSDIALLFLKSQVEFSAFIQPVCLSNDATIMDHFNGTVVGWGKSESETSHENIPREVSIRAVNTEVCFEQDPDLGKIYSRTTFCAGGEGVGPCTGDSGGGFFVQFQGLWTLRGMVSAGSMSNGGFSCDLGRFTLFTKLIDFSKWIRETVERS